MIIKKYLSHNGNLIQRGANKFIYRNYTPPTPDRDGIILRIELTNSQHNNIGFNSVSVDGVPIQAQDIYKGRSLAWGSWNTISDSDLERLISGQNSIHCNTIELWIAKPYASSLSFTTINWMLNLETTVYIDEYVNPDTITGELVSTQKTLSPGVEYTYNW